MHRIILYTHINLSLYSHNFTDTNTLVKPSISPPSSSNTPTTFSCRALRTRETC